MADQTTTVVQPVILPYLEYASLFWSNTCENNLFKVQVAQNCKREVV